MKNLTKVILCMAIIVCSLLVSYILFMKYYEEHQFDVNKIETKKVYDPSSVLCGAIERENWDNLALSENFRKKYETRVDIIPDIKKYSIFSSGYSDVDGKRCIIISADVSDMIFEIGGENKVTTLFYFDYKSNENNELDDISLIKTKRVDSMTGKNVIE